MTSEAEVNSVIPKPEIFAKEYTGAKPKATLPLRVLDEEVWLSGSELKTDNSSSDEEKPELEGLKENRTKKGARRKTKCSKTNYTKSTKLRLTETKSHLTETIELQDEVVSSSDNSDFDYEKDVQKRKKQIDLFKKKIEKREEYCLCSYQANDEAQHLQQIVFLQEEIKQAERKYKVAKKNTDAMVSQMAEYLETMESLTEPEWTHFVDIAKQWIACFRKTQSFGAHKHTRIAELEENIQTQEDLVKPIKKHKARKLAKNYGHLKCGKTRSLRLKKIQEPTNKKTSLDIVLARIETESKESSYNEPYKLTADELSRIQEIENKLDSFRSCNSTNDLSAFNQTSTEESYHKVYSDNFAPESLDVNEEKEKTDEGESEKNNFNLPDQISLSKNSEDELLNEFCNESISDYNSCVKDNLSSENE